MKTNMLALILPVFLLASCASVNSYHEPKAGTQPLATVSGSSLREGLTEWSNFDIYSIDNKVIGMHWSENSKINVTPGSHLFVITSAFNQGLFTGGPYSSITEVRATLQAGRHYRFIGKPDGAHMTVWAIDQSNRRISEVGASTYQHSPSTGGGVIFVNTRH